MTAPERGLGSPEAGDRLFARIETASRLGLVESSPAAAPRAR